MQKNEHALLKFDATWTLFSNTTGDSFLDVITQDPINTLFQQKSAKKSSELVEQDLLQIS